MRSIDLSTTLVMIGLMSCSNNPETPVEKIPEPMLETVVMFGDSHMQYGNWQEAFPNFRMLNYGIGGDPTEGLVIRTERVVALKPDKVFIEAGANDVYFGMEDSKTIANFETILKQLSEELPKAEVYVLSIFPNDLPSPRSNASSFIWIEQLNKELKQLCDKRSVPFIDLSATLELERALNPAYDSGDRIHLNEAGYNKVVEAISPYLQAD